MSEIDEAMQTAWALFRSKRGAQREFGHLLFSSGGKLRLGPFVESPTSDSVDLYGESAHVRILSTLEAGASERFFGDYHAHPVGESWMSQFPSPDDVVSVSVANDFWPTAVGVELQVVPEVQLVQSLMFGDIFVLERFAQRIPFDTLQQQDTAMRAIQAAYSQAHMTGHAQHGNVPEVAAWDVFRAVVDDVLPKFNAALAGRATIRMVKSPDSLAAWSRADDRAAEAKRQKNRDKRARRDRRRS